MQSIDRLRQRAGLEKHKMDTLSWINVSWIKEEEANADWIGVDWDVVV
tara:strand:+ start:427 stop:570 length:144 start_codon:yes stop_codon:yes gene_type:complete